MQKLIKLSKSEKLYKYLITTLAVAIPLYPKFPLFNVPGTYVSIRLEDFLFVLSSILFLPLILKDFKELIKNKIFKSILLFLTIGFISVISAIIITKTVLPHIAFLHLVRRIQYLSLFLFGFLYVKNFYDKNFFGYLIKVVGLIIGFAFVYGLLQRYFSFPVIITQNMEYSKGIALRWIPGSHINSTFAGHYDLASYLVLVLPVFIGGIFNFKNLKIKIYFMIISLMGYWLLSNAVSRISIVSFLISASITLLLLKKYKEIVIFGMISIVLFGFSPGLRERYLRIFEVVKEKLVLVQSVYAQDEVEVFEDRSTSIRLVVEWPRALRALTKNPILGTGYSSISLATDNDYLRALGEVGILGFSAFMLILLNLTLIFINFIKKFKMRDLNKYEKVFITAIAGGFVGSLINATFIDIFEASKFATMFWLFTGILIAYIQKRTYEQYN